MIRIIPAENTVEIGKCAADVVTEVLNNKKNAVLGFSFGFH